MPRRSSSTLRSLYEWLRGSLTRREWKLRSGHAAALGAQGEDAACEYLRHQGYTIVARNARLTAGEADIVALDPDGITYVIVEVKSRTKNANQPSRSAAARGEENITTEKAQTLRTIAATLARANNWPRSRIDVVAVDIYPDRFAIRHHARAL
jgi:putative endonuclease